MPDSRITYTPHLSLSKLPANFHVWAQIMNDNLTTIDAAVSGFILIQNLRGQWTNSTAYAAGDSVVDTSTALIWRCQVDNISSTIPMTFAQERIAFPLYWVQYSTVGAGKGTWTGPGTSYVFNDFVVDHGRYAVCILPHTSTGSFNADVASGYWNILIDVSLYLPLAGGTLTGPLIGTTATFNSGGSSTLTATGIDNANTLRLAGATKGIRFSSNATGSNIEGVDNTWIGSFQPLSLGGSTVNIAAPLTGTTAAFSGEITAATPISADNDTTVATTAFVKAQSYLTTTAASTTYLPLVGGTLTGPGNLAVAGTLGVTGATTLSAALTGTTATFNSPDNLNTTNIVIALPNNGSLGVGIWYSGIRAIAANSDLHVGGNGVGIVRSDTIIAPNTDNTLSCGISSARWSVVYAGTGAINTSGRDEKLDIAEPSDAERKAAARIKAIGPKRYKFKDAVAAKGGKARWHIGYVAEDVRDALAAEGLDPWAYGLLCADEVEGYTRLGLRYDELQSFLMVA